MHANFLEKLKKDVEVHGRIIFGWILEIGREGVGCIKLAAAMVQWWALVKTVQSEEFLDQLKKY
jgi:hypothetical protein